MWHKGPFIYVIFIVTVPLLRAVTYDGSWYTRDDDRHHYFFSWTAEYWTDAQGICRGMGGDLVTINDASENAFLETLPESGSHWIGLEMNCSDSRCTRFSWSNGDDVEFTDWYSSNPSQSTGYNYTFKNFQSGNWYNRRGTYRYFYVCEFNDECFPNNPCFGVTICVSDMKGVHSCLPASQVNECDSNQCVNGECRDILRNYTCICDQGYEGRNCDTDINECRTEPNCVYGTCQNYAGSYACNCMRGFYGDRCQYSIDECENNNCVNGRCVDGIAEYTCACSSGYTGKYCEQDIDECLDSKLCQHGDCKDTDGGYECTCSDGYFGDKCNFGPSTSKEVAIAATAMVLLFVTAIPLVIFLVLKIKKLLKRETKPRITAKKPKRSNDYLPQAGAMQADRPGYSQQISAESPASEPQLYQNVQRAQESQDPYTHLTRK